MKQAPMLYTHWQDDKLKKMGFNRCPICPCLYQFRQDNMNAMAVIHVDDILVMCNSKELFDDFKPALLEHCPKVTQVYPLQKFIGIQMEEDIDNHTITMNQEIYINALENPHAASKDEKVPMYASINLRRSTPNEKNDSLLPTVGKIRFLADRTRPDILVAAGELASGGSVSPSDDHVKTAGKTINYLKSSKDLKLKLGSRKPIKLFGFVDASYSKDFPCTCRMGGALYLSDDCGAFYTFSKLSTLVAVSSTHAEILSSFELVRIIIFIRYILEFLGRKMKDATILYIDNKSAIELCEALKITPTTSAMNPKIAYLRECINNRLIELHFVPTKLNCADVLTKGLSSPFHEQHTTTLLTGLTERDKEYLIEEAFVIRDVQFDCSN
jgi:hypothetical protein